MNLILLEILEHTKKTKTKKLKSLVNNEDNFLIFLAPILLFKLRIIFDELRVNLINNFFCFYNSLHEKNTKVAFTLKVKYRNIFSFDESMIFKSVDWIILNIFKVPYAT